MTSTIETLLVVLVVGVASAWAGRAIWRSLRGKDKGKCSGCAGSNGCASENKTTNLVELGKIESSGPDTSGDNATPKKNDNN